MASYQRVTCLALLGLGWLAVSLVGRTDAAQLTIVNEDNEVTSEDEEEIELDTRNIKMCNYGTKQVVDRFPCTAECGGGVRNITYFLPDSINKQPKTWQIECANSPCQFDFPEECHCVPADIIFVLDRSCSITLFHWQKVIQFIEDFLVAQHRMIADEHKDRVRIAIIVFDSNVTMEYGLRNPLTLANLVELRENILQLQYTPPLKATVTADALVIADEEFSKWSTEDTPQVAFIITDGKSTQSWKLEDAVNQLNRAYRSIFALGVAKYDIDEIMLMVDGDQERAFFADSFEDLSNILTEAVHHLCCSSNKLECTPMLETECSKTCGPGVKHVTGSCEVWRYVGDHMTLIGNKTVDEEKFCCLGDCPSTTRVVNDNSGGCLEPQDYCYPVNPCINGGECANTRCGYMCVLPITTPTTVESIPGETCGN